MFLNVCSQILSFLQPCKDEQKSGQYSEESGVTAVSLALTSLRNFPVVNLKMARSSNNVCCRWENLPSPVLDTLFSFMETSDLRNCALVCSGWYRFLNDENNDVWRLHCIRKLAEEALKSDLLTGVPSYKAKLRAFYHAWNPNDCSRNIYIKSNGFTLHRNPVAQSTDAARGKLGFRNGRHCWEVWWEGPLGTVAVVGIATKMAHLQCHGYVALMGADRESWGWNLVDNHLLHNGDTQGNYPQLNNAPIYQVISSIRTSNRSE